MSRDVTQILVNLSAGDDRAAAELLPLVYDELRGLAARYLAGERIDHTLQPTALVHEAFLRLVHFDQARWQDRAHFYRVAAEAMRRILVNHARDRRRLKRGGGGRKLALEDFDAIAPEAPVDLVALDDALNRLATIDARKVQIAQLRYFGGFTIEETARILDISTAQLKRDWALAKAWLLRELLREPGA